MRRLRYLICIMTFFTLTCIFQTGYAQDRSNYNSLLERLGVSDFGVEYEDGECISRRSFMISLAELMTGEKVTAEEAFNIIKTYRLTYAENLKDFEGENDILSDEMIKMLVCLLGRNTIALSDGGYPEGYYKVAYDTDLLKGSNVIQGRAVTKGQLRRVFINLIDSTMTQGNIGSTNAIEYQSTERTFLENYRGIVKKIGIVDSNEYTSVYGGSGSKGNISVNGERYNINDVWYNELLGRKIVLYVNDDTEMIVHAYPYNTEDTVVINDEDIVGVSGDYRSFKYLKANDRTDDYKISTTVKVIYNNVFYKDYVESTFKPVSGYVRLIDNDDDDVIDVVDIHDYKVGIVNYISVSDLTITSDYGTLDTVLNLEECDTVTITQNEKEIGFADIKNGTVIRVAQSSDGEVAEIRVSDNVITDMSTYINDEKVFVGENEYELAGEFKTLLALNTWGFVDITVGAEQVFYIDCFGKIVAVKNRSETEEIYVYAFNIYADDNDDICMRYMSTDSGINIVKFDEKVRTNITTSSGAEKVYTALGAENFVPQLLKIKLNSEGMVSSVHKATDYFEGSTDLFTKHKVSTANFRKRTTQAYSTYVFSNQGIQQGFIEDKTIIFFIGNDMVDSYIGFASDFTDGRNYDIELYNLDEYKFSDLVVCKTNDSNLNTVGSFLITGKNVALNSQDEVMGVFKASVEGIMDIEIKVKDVADLDKAEPGDLVKFNVDGMGNIKYQETTYSPRNGKVYMPITSQGSMTVSGELKKISFGDGIDGRVRFECNGNEYVCPILATKSIDIFDMKTKTSYHGTLKDLVVGDYFVGSVDAFRLTSIRVYRNI